MIPLAKTYLILFRVLLTELVSLETLFWFILHDFRRRKEKTDVQVRGISRALNVQLIEKRASSTYKYAQQLLIPC